MSKDTERFIRREYISGCTATTSMAVLPAKRSIQTYAGTIGTQRVDLQQGQLVYGCKAVSERLHMTEGKLRSAITQMERMGKIRIEPAQRYSIITVLDRGWLTDIDAEW